MTTVVETPRVRLPNGLDISDDGSSAAQVVDDDFPGVLFTLRFGSDHRVVGFEMACSGGDITPRMLKSVRLGELTAAVRRHLSGEIEYGPLGQPRRIAEWSRSLTERPRPGAAGRDDRFYVAIAAQYEELANKPVRNPVEQLATRLGYSASQLRNVLLEARNRKLLTSMGPGRAGGELTPEGRALLTDM